MNVEKIPKSGTTPSRKVFFDSVADIVSSLTKKEGRNVSVHEFRGCGTIINVNPQRDNSQGGGGEATGACCIDGECSITTEADCIDAGGVYEGDDTECDPNPCCDCSDGVSVTIETHAVGSGEGCPTMDVTDTLSFSIPAGGGTFSFTPPITHHCLDGCSGDFTAIAGSASYLGLAFCSGGVFSLTIEGIGICCAQFLLPLPCTPEQQTGSCECDSAAGAIPDTISCPGIYTYSFSGSGGGMDWSLDVVITVTMP